MGTSNGAITVRPIRSQTITIHTPTMTTQGRFVRRLSPRTMDTRLGTTSPRNGRAPITTVTTPVATATMATPVRITAS